MKWTVSQAAKQMGVSVRTLHYYEEIGLLLPAEKTGSGYRLYGQREISRLQQILFYRELDIPLKKIREILSRPDFPSQEVLRQHKELLCCQKRKLEEQIRLVEGLIQGEDIMNQEHPMTQEWEDTKRRYAKEVQEKWGDTPAYQEYRNKTAGYTKEQWKTAQEEADHILSRISQGMLQGKSPDSPEIQSLIQAWRDYITRYYYTCTKEILEGLGQMYGADSRFRESLGRYAPGTASFLQKAIAVYCRDEDSL